MINEQTPVEAWMQIHYLRNNGERDIKVAYSCKKYLKSLRAILNRNDQPYENPYGEPYLIAYPT